MRTTETVLPCTHPECYERVAVEYRLEGGYHPAFRGWNGVWEEAEGPEVVIAAVYADDCGHQQDWDKLADDITDNPETWMEA